MSEHVGEKTEHQRLRSWKKLEKRPVPPQRRGADRRRPHGRNDGMMFYGRKSGSSWPTPSLPCSPFARHPRHSQRHARLHFNGVLVLGHCVWPSSPPRSWVACSPAASRPGSHRPGRSRFQLGAAQSCRRLETRFLMRSAVPPASAFSNFLSSSPFLRLIKSVLTDPIFHSSVDVARIAGFMAESSFKIILASPWPPVLASVDYGYQIWRTTQDLMMTKEGQGESKSSDGNPRLKPSNAASTAPIPSAKCLWKCLRLTWFW